MDASEPGRHPLATRVLILAIVAGALLLVPLRIVQLGFLPASDARRHVAKAVADRPWSEILVLRAEATTDLQPGWHAILGVLHRAGASPGRLLVVATVGLAALVLWVPLAGRFRPEAWLLALLAAALAEPGFWKRLLLGRPFLISMAVLLALGLAARRLASPAPERATVVGLAALFALATWLHGGWYLFLLPIAAFAWTGPSGVARRLAAAWGAGVVVGAILTGAPIAFLTQTARHPIWALSTDMPRTVLVDEFQPSGGSLAMVLLVGAVVALRSLRGGAGGAPARDPLLVLAVAGWALGLYTLRFWLDWGLPAALLWMASEIDEALPWRELGGRRRVLLASVVAAVLVLAVTADVRGRWTRPARIAALDATLPAHQPWLPDPGGVLVSNSMDLFYGTFFRNPRGPWRYLLGFEPALMPPADRAIYERVVRSGASDASLRPWAERLTPADRLAVVRPTAPALPELDWHAPVPGLWVGRRTVASAEATSSPGTVGDGR